MSVSKVVVTRERICEALGIGKNAFYDLVKEGLPVKKRGHRWSGHMDDIENFFRESPASYDASKKAPK